MYKCKWFEKLKHSTFKLKKKSKFIPCEKKKLSLGCRGRIINRKEYVHHAADPLFYVIERFFCIIAQCIII